MRWYWRASIAMLAGLVYGGLSVSVLDSPHNWMMETIMDAFGSRYRVGVAFAAPIAFFLPVLLVSGLTYGLLTRRFGPKRAWDGETRCRKCDYILRGISEPRCPECGERI